MERKTVAILMVIFLAATIFVMIFWLILMGPNLISTNESDYILAFTHPLFIVMVVLAIPAVVCEMYLRFKR